MKLLILSKKNANFSQIIIKNIRSSPGPLHMCQNNFKFSINI